MNKIVILSGLIAIAAAGTLAISLTAVPAVPAAPEPDTPEPESAPVELTEDPAICDRLLAQILNPSTPLEEFDRIEAELIENNCGG